MKLLRFGAKGQEKPGLLDTTGNIRDLSSKIIDLSGHSLSASSLKILAELDPTSLPLVEPSVRIGPCVNHVGKFMCIGLNYLDHIRETGTKRPSEPILFMKATSAICGAYDDLIIPRNSQKTDWEVELGVIIGTVGKYITIDQALDYVAGYCIVNDVSERAWQLEGTGQWTKGKSADTFAPIGPWLVTKDEITNPQNLALWTEVDGVRYQHSNTQNMLFGVAELISYLSNFLTLYPGDIIATGTPPGVGLGQKPSPIFLKPGQTIKLGIDGLGQQQQKTVIEQ